MRNNRYICVFDFETDGVNPLVCNPIQVAAVMLDPRTLNICDQFVSMMKPPYIDDEKYFEKHKETIEWHAKTKNVKAETILKSWKKAPDTKLVWKSFKEFNFKFHTKQTNQGSFTAPIPAGYNIVNFDIPIAHRLCKEYGYLDTNGRSKLFSAVNKFDVYDMVFSWFENLTEPEALNAETLFAFLGLDTTGAHDALVDVTNTAKVLIRFLNFQRRIVPTSAKFKGAMLKNET